MIRRILIPLDVLLDTRLGTLQRINPEAAKVVINNPLYWERDYDNWTMLTNGLVTNEEFAKAYAERGGDNSAATLNGSVESNLAPFLYQMLIEADINQMDGMTRHMDEVGIAVNTAPYNLPLEARTDLVAIIQEKYGKELNVKLVDYPISELTIGCLAEEFSAMIIYEFAEWFRYHHVEIVGSLMSDFNVIHPKLFDRDPSELTMDERKTEFFRFRLMTQHNLDINFIDARYFSIINPKSSLAPPTEHVSRENLATQHFEIDEEFRDLLRGNIKATP